MYFSSIKKGWKHTIYFFVCMVPGFSTMESTNIPSVVFQEPNGMHTVVLVTKMLQPKFFLQNSFCSLARSKDNNCNCFCMPIYEPMTVIYCISALTTIRQDITNRKFVECYV